MGENDVIAVTDMDKEECAAPAQPSGPTALPSATSPAFTLVSPPPSPSVVATTT